MDTASTLGRANSRPLLQDLLKQVFVVEWATKDYRTILAQLQSDYFSALLLLHGAEAILHCISELCQFAINNAERERSKHLLFLQPYFFFRLL